jgi:hypothetical protein
MTTANVNDRSTVEAVYPREAFAADAAENARGKTTILRGVLITSEVSESGGFAMQRASRHVSERDPLGDTRFLAPFLRDTGATLDETAAYGAAREKPERFEQAERGDEYAAFIDWVIAAATGAEFKTPIGRHEGRLRGFHGG